MERADIVLLAEEIAKAFYKQREATVEATQLNNGCLTLLQFDKLPNCDLKQEVITFSKENPMLLQLDIAILMSQFDEIGVLELRGPVKSQEGAVPFGKAAMIDRFPKTFSRSDIEALFGYDIVDRAVRYNRQIQLTVRLD